MTKASKTADLGKCQVQSNTDYPCPRPAVVELWGMAFCEPCARGQRAYFAIGELTKAQRLPTDRELAEGIAEAVHR